MFTNKSVICNILVKIQCIVGGEPEHKRVATKCMREEIHAHNNGELYLFSIEIKINRFSLSR